MKFEAGNKGVSLTYQEDFPETTECYCGCNARIAFVVQEDCKEDGICDLHPSELSKGGKFWNHDYCVVAVYFCEVCAEAVAIRNQA